MIANLVLGSPVQKLIIDLRMFNYTDNLTTKFATLNLIYFPTINPFLHNHTRGFLLIRNCQPLVLDSSLKSGLIWMAAGKASKSSTEQNQFAPNPAHIRFNVIPHWEFHLNEIIISTPTPTSADVLLWRILRIRMISPWWVQNFQIYAKKYTKIIH